MSQTLTRNTLVNGTVHSAGTAIEKTGATPGEIESLASLGFLTTASGETKRPKRETIDPDSEANDADSETEPNGADELDSLDVPKRVLTALRKAGLDTIAKVRAELEREGTLEPVHGITEATSQAVEDALATLPS